MAKFELYVYDMKTEEVKKVHQRNKIPVDLFIKYQDLAEELRKSSINDKELFLRLKDIFLETFPSLTEAEYLKGTDTAEVLAMYRKLIDKATEFETGNSKNA